MRWAILVCALAGAAHAEDKTAEAKELFAKGLTLFNAGFFEAATDAFEAGYRLAPLPLFLFNAGQAARRGGKKVQALAFYQRFLEADPAAPERPEAAARIHALEEELKPKPPKSIDEPKPAVAVVAEAPPRRWARDPLGGALVGVGAAVAIVGVGLLANGGAILGRAGDSYEAFDQAHGAQPFTISGGVMLAAGLVVMAGGAVRYALVARRHR